MGIVAALSYLKVRKVFDISMPRLKKEMLVQMLLQMLV